MLFSFKRPLSLLFALTISVFFVSLTLTSDKALAKDESYQYATLEKKTITGNGGIFTKGVPRTFNPVDSITVGANVPDGYSAFFANNGSITDCKIYLAVNTTTNKLKVMKEQSQCPGNQADFLGSNGIDTQISIGNSSTEVKDTRINAAIDGAYSILGPLLTPVRDTYYASLGTSDTPSETEWKAMVYECWDGARKAAASLGRSGTTDAVSATRNSFASCMSGKTGISASAITETIKSVDVAAVNTAIDTGTSAIDKEESEAGETRDEDASTCKVEGVGWIVCPVMNFMGMITDGSYTVVAAMLNTPVSMFDEGSTEGQHTRAVWSIMRNIANVLFVIAFMVIIYSQLTSAGVSNYGVKKLLPKLIVSAILVNMSFIICALAVDLSNVIGGATKGMFDAIGASVQVAEDGMNAGNGGDTFANITGGILAGTLTVGISMYVGLSALLPILISALAAIVTVVVVLTMRQALIVLLIVVAPLAFVALLLPNTEGWFKKWRGVFFTMLLMYPAVAAIFGASALAGQIIMNSGDNVLLQIMGAGVTIIPLFITPVIMKAAGGVLNRFAGIVNNTDKGMFDRMRKGAGSVRERSENRRAIRSMNGGKVIGGGRFRRQAKREAIDNSLKRVRQGQEQQYIAREAMDDENNATQFGRKLAGAGPLGGGADATAIQSALANAKFTIDEATAKEIKAEEVFVREMNSDAIKAALDGGGNSEAKTAALLQRLVRISDPGDSVDSSGNTIKGYESYVNDAIQSSSSTVRRSAAETLGKEGPAFMKASDLDNIATGAYTATGAKSGEGLSTIAKTNVDAGVISQEKMVEMPSGDIKYAFDNATAGRYGGQQLLVNTASDLNANQNLRGRIKHNRKEINNLRLTGSPH